MEDNMTNERKVFLVLSPKSLPYSTQCIKSLFANCLERLLVILITDSVDDKQELIEAVSKIPNPHQSNWQVFSKSDADAIAAEKFDRYPNIRSFRNGHPCWRKITDPLLFVEDDEETIVLDPDLYFPNKFKFEPTPEKSVLLMWQPPSCLQPAETVRSLFDLSVKLAHHVDIGVAQWRKPPDLTWLDSLLGKLVVEKLPSIMFVEATIWSALAMEMGGGYLDAKRWRCWYMRHWKRVLIKSGFPVSGILKMEKLHEIKCFHATGPSKWWIKEAYEGGKMEQQVVLDANSKITPFVEFTQKQYEFEQNIKKFLWKIGYYSFINPSWGKLEREQQVKAQI
jgi:hypothetical protein